MESTQMAPVDVFASTVQTILLLAVWIIYSLSGHVMGKKLRHPAPWLAWVPIVNLFYFVNLAGRSFLTALGLFIPIVNVFVYGLVFADIAERLDMPKWLGWCMLLPVANVFIMPYLAAAGTRLPTVRPRPARMVRRAVARTS